MNLNQLVEDAAAVTRYLMNKFNRQKIYILGHSWGSLLSSFTIHKYPEYYYAYIGIGQIANTYLSEKESYQFVLEEAKNRNDENAQGEILRLKFPDRTASGKEWYEYYKIQRKYVLEYGGARYIQSRSYNDIAKTVLFCREYTIQDKLNYYAGTKFSQVYLDEYMTNINLNNVLTDQYIPIYIFQGLHDHQTSYPVAKEYFDHLKAPVKKFFPFSNSAHSPHIEEYDKFEQIVITDILGSQKEE
jgi:pimeloyl-ACP methyl ester carboxylesterase